jgi:hypothetical protein
MGAVNECRRKFLISSFDPALECRLPLGHDGACDPHPHVGLGTLFATMFETVTEENLKARTFQCRDADDVASLALWARKGDTVQVPRGTVMPRGKMVPGVTYEVASPLPTQWLGVRRPS